MNTLAGIFRFVLCSLTVSLLSASYPLASAAEPDFSQFEPQFRDLPMEARRLTGPLFWLHGDDSRERLEMYVGKVAEGGNGSFTTESRPHTDWLGPKWWRDLDICLDAAKKQNLQMWIFDEKWWPSQAVAGKVPPRYAAKRLDATSTLVNGPRLYEADGFKGQHYIAAVAGRITPEGKLDASSLLDLAEHVEDGKLRWNAPDGKWRIMVFTHKQAPGLIQQNRTQLSVDGASRDCVDWFLETVYQPHFDHYKADFGKTIRGFFYDEPETPGDWGTELNRVLSERKVDWKKAYAAYKFELAGEEQVAARFQYRDALAEAWGRTMYGGVSEWCRRHGVKSIGHFMEHANLYFHPEFCAGDMMRLQGYSDMGAIDAVFDQFVMGKRVTRDAPCWQTPKLGSSISHAYGKAEDIAMVEIFGARGQDLTYTEMKWWTDHMQVSGINFLIPHSFNPKSPHDTDCPPYFYNGGFEPRWPLYRVFADYTSRLSLMLTGGRHVCPVALLFPGQSIQCGKHVLPDQISAALQDALYDCDWLPTQVFEKDTTIRGGELRLRLESYRVLVIPGVEVIPYATLAKAKEFFEQGGVVVACGFLPTKSATLGKTSADIARLCDTIWGSAQPGEGISRESSRGGRSLLLPAEPSPEQLQRALAANARVHPTLEVLEGNTDHWLHVLHRVKSGRDVFFIANQNHQGEARVFHFRITAEGLPEWWDAMRNEFTAVPFSRKGRQVELRMSLEPNESALLVFQSNKRNLPARPLAAPLPARTVVVEREPISARPQPGPEPIGSAAALRGCSWVWFPEGDPAQAVPAATRYFRRRITLPESRTIKQATFVGTADNSFILCVNGEQAGHGDNSAEGWRNPATIDVTRRVRPGANQLAIAAVNSGDKPNPAGLIGRLEVEFDSGAAVSIPIDKTWKVSNLKSENWASFDCDDNAWPSANQIGPLGCAPWGALAVNITMSPAKADPFAGYCQVSKADLEKFRVYLVLQDPKPELAARIRVNGKDAGGFIGRPTRLEITKVLEPGRNTFLIEPFAPQAASLAFYPR